MDRLEFRLLGRVEVTRGGRPVDVGGPKHRAVLSSLALRPGLVVSVDQIVDDLWPEQPPARAAATVQVFVSQLRRALEPDRNRGEAAIVLVTASPGYRLDVDPDAVDAHTFAGLVASGRDALEAADPEQAARRLRQAEQLWHGPALADVPVTPFVREAVARLTELQLGATEGRIEAELALGRHTALVAELQQQVSRHPLRERLRAQLMLCLYRCGRQVDALRTYRETREVLNDELGLDPGLELRELEQKVLRQDPELAWTPPTPPGSSRPRSGASRTSPPLPPGASPERRGRVLVVDDTSINRKLLASAVAELGHEVHTAENGHEALELLREAAEESPGFDIVLLDLLMPVLDGYATLAQIKADPALSGVPVIMVSAVPELESVVQCIEMGATDYLPKPYSSAMLRARLGASLAARRSSAEREIALRDEIADLREQIARTGAGPERR